MNLQWVCVCGWVCVLSNNIILCLSRRIEKKQTRSTFGTAWPFGIDLYVGNSSE